MPFTWGQVVQPFKKILCAIDLGRYTDDVAQAATVLAVQTQCALTFIHIIAEKGTGLGWSGSGSGRFAISIHQLNERVKEESVVLERMRPFQTAAQKLTSGEVSLEVSSGNPAETLIAASESGEYDVIVLGSGVHPGLIDSITGTITSKVVRKAQCSIFLVHHRAT